MYSNYLIPMERAPGTPLDRGLCGPQTQSDTVAKRIMLLHLARIKPIIQLIISQVTLTESFYSPLHTIHFPLTTNINMWHNMVDVCRGNCFTNPTTNLSTNHKKNHSKIKPNTVILIQHKSNQLLDETIQNTAYYKSPSLKEKHVYLHMLKHQPFIPS